MVTQITEVKSKLDGINLPVVYEQFLQPENIPCISILEMGNAEQHSGNTLGYSRIMYQVKIWHPAVKDAYDYAQQIDNKMAELNYKRDSVIPMNRNEIICLVLTYSALVKENYTIAR